MPDPESVEAADIELGQTLASKKEHPWVQAVVEVGKLGDQEPLYAYGAVATLFGLLTWNRRSARIGVSMILAVAGADVIKRIVKRLVKRTRPHVLLDEGRYETEAGGSSSKPEQSFPSGHVACTLAASRAISRQAPAAAPWTTSATLIIAAARLAKGAHWPLDVAAGLVIGFVSETISSLLLRALGMPQEPERRD